MVGLYARCLIVFYLLRLIYEVHCKKNPGHYPGIYKRDVKDYLLNAEFFVGGNNSSSFLSSSSPRRFFARIFPLGSIRKLAGILLMLYCFAMSLAQNFRSD